MYHRWYKYHWLKSAALALINRYQVWHDLIFWLVLDSEFSRTYTQSMEVPEELHMVGILFFSPISVSSLYCRL